jgi:hypothetical protein
VGNPDVGQGSESSDEARDTEQLDSWWLREIYIQALAAGVSDEEYSQLTLSRVIAHIEAEKHRRYWHARPIVTSMLPHLDRKALRAIASGGKGGGDNVSARAVAKMLEEYMPASASPRHSRLQQPKVVKDLPWEAAQGVVIAFERGMLTGELWASISQWYPRISLTAKRGRRGEDR